MLAIFHFIFASWVFIEDVACMSWLLQEDGELLDDPGYVSDKNNDTYLAKIRLGRMWRSYFLILSSKDALFVFRHTVICLKPVFRVMILGISFIIFSALLFYNWYGEVNGLQKNIKQYFPDFCTSLDSLMVAMTSANFPDVMVPYYQVRKFEGYELFSSYRLHYELRRRF